MPAGADWSVAIAAASTSCYSPPGSSCCLAIPPARDSPAERRRLRVLLAGSAAAGGACLSSRRGSGAADAAAHALALRVARDAGWRAAAARSCRPPSRTRAPPAPLRGWPHPPPRRPLRTGAPAPPLARAGTWSWGWPPTSCCTRRAALRPGARARVVVRRDRGDPRRGPRLSRPLARMRSIAASSASATTRSNPPPRRRGAASPPARRRRRDCRSGRARGPRPAAHGRRGARLDAGWSPRYSRARHAPGTAL